MDQYLIYLRKSRKDRETELQTGSFDTLQRHRDALLGLAKQRGYAIADIFEEVVSGDTIAERPEMQKLLSAVESGAYAGVLVMEVARLARGNTRDQGTVAETFQYSETKIITPEKTYDPSDEADEEYFEFGLFMSRREYKTINRRLQRGRIASLNEGKYIAGTAPYGYEKIKIPHQRGYTLQIVPEKADVVREIFRLYTEGDPQPNGTMGPVGSFAIANLLNARGIVSPGGTKWAADSVRNILKNPTYAGFIRWAYRPVHRQMQNGEIVTSTPVNKEAMLVCGLHVPIISQQTWTAACSTMTGRAHAPVPSSKRVSNPLVGLIYCSVCGRSLVQLPQKNRGISPQLMCPTPKCPTMSSRRDAVESALLDGLQNWLNAYQVDAAGLPSQKGNEAPLADIRRSLMKARAQVASLEKQRGSLYDLLEQGVYSQEVFLERSRVVASRIQEAERTVKVLSAHLAAQASAENARKNVVPRVQNVLDMYGQLDSPAARNALLRTAVERVIYSKTTGGRYGKSNMHLHIYPKISTASNHL